MQPIRWIFARASIALIALTLLAACASPNLGRMTSPEDWRAEMQPPLDPEIAQRLETRPTLDLLLRLGLERNPGVAAERRRWLAAIHTEPQAVSLSDPMLELENIFESTSLWNVKLMQEVPWWQKIWARGRVARAEAAIARLRYEAMLRDLIIDTKDAYYELYYFDQALPITERVESLLRNEAVLAYSELTVGRTQINEAFRAESQAAQLGYDRVLLAEQRAVQVERLRALINLPPGTVIGPVLGAPVYSVAPSIEPLFAKAERYAEALRTRGLEIQRAEYETFLAKLSRIPDLSIGFNFVQMVPMAEPAGEMEEGAPEEGEIDEWMGMLSMNLPIWEQRNRALIRERKATEEAMRRMALQELNQTRQAVAQAWFRVRLAERLAELYARVLLPQAEAVMRQAEVFFRSDQASFSNLLETTIAWHNFMLAYHRAVADHGQAIGQLERAIGAIASAEPTAPRVDEFSGAPAGSSNVTPALPREGAPSAAQPGVLGPAPASGQGGVR